MLPPPVVRKQRICKVCGATFEHKSELRAHRRSEHGQVGADGNSIDLAPDMLLVGDGNTGMLVVLKHINSKARYMFLYFIAVFVYSTAILKVEWVE